MKYILILLLITFSFLNADSASDVKITQIDKKIIHIQTKIDFIMKKGNLNNEDQMKWFKLTQQKKKLMNEKLSIVEKNNAALSEEEKRLTRENAALEKQLQLADKKLEVLNRISKVLDGKVKASR